MILGDSHHRIFAWSVAIFCDPQYRDRQLFYHRSEQPRQSGSRGSSLRLGQGDPPDAQGDPNSSSASVESGKELFVTLGCTGCHVVNGKGGLAGPDLSNEANKGRSRAVA